jgi:ParB-like chromosome segregation protein Spo0J
VIPATVAVDWPAQEVTMQPLEELIPHARNARTHSDAQIAQIAASMREFGWVNPVLVDEQGTIIAGHGRILAARQLHWTVAPVMVARRWSDAKKRAYMIADNKLALNPEWDSALLYSELESLKDEEFPADFLGFSDADLKRLNDDLAEGRFDRIGGQQEDSGEERPATNADEVALTIPMKVPDRNLVFEAINAAKIAFELPNAGEALCQICRLYLEQK